MELQDVLKTVFTVLLSSGLTAFFVYLKTTKGKIKALQDGMLSLLRAEIIRSHDKYLFMQKMLSAKRITLITL